MQVVEKNVLVAHTPAQMFALVDSVEHYPGFLPWCARSVVHEREGNHLVASLHIDYLKIDRTFVSNLVTDENDMVLSEAIIIMAHKLGLQVIAEGVESERQSHMLSEAGCDYAQGYMYSKPIPPSKFELLLKNGFGDCPGDTVSGVG